MRLPIVVAALASLAGAYVLDKTLPATKMAYEPSMGSCSAISTALIEPCFGTFMFCAFGHYKDNNETYASGQACAADRGLNMAATVPGIIDEEAYKTAAASLSRANQYIAKYYQSWLGAWQRAQRPRLEGGGDEDFAARAKRIRESKQRMAERTLDKSNADREVEAAKEAIQAATVPEVAREILKMVDQAGRYTADDFYSKKKVHGWYMDALTWMQQAMYLEE
ncbi:hypothetical protein JDV02_002926 [Purpureocillium takamizusanense]|uniref:Uncharacterized protein n=1 Tax=Purpureocillium takamizusanense TaxID=2060973 RepID=A0A9Q8QBD9_9HYPO|nr:uncharacterized protein JDV02_002926 [Purpureocillium takamizusanense]UNI16495.1 hypothetical protein JDV02_002926 [Purpureocillium takamizusanense]